MNRRAFVQKSALASAGLVTMWEYPRLGQEQKIKVGLIGCGWYGMVITRAALKTGEVEVLAVCDVDSAHLSESAAEIEKLQGKRPAVYKDYRELGPQRAGYHFHRNSAPLACIAFHCRL